MTILDQLSSSQGDRTEQANCEVVRLCLENSSLLEDIKAGLDSTNADLAGDCAEVFTQVAETRPDLVAPFTQAIAAKLSHRKTRVRWEAMHALALVAAHRPDVITTHLDELANLLRTDSSVIVRDYAVETLGAFAATSPAAVRTAYPVLTEALTLWNGKQAGHALNALRAVVAHAPELRDDIRAAAVHHTTHGRPVVQKAAKSLLKSLD